MINIDVIIVCHTEFGFVKDKEVIADKNKKIGARKGVLNLIRIADRYNAKICFAIMPEVAEYIPKDIKHEIGIHIHPGYLEFEKKKIKYYVGDSYLRKHCKQSVNSTILSDFSYDEQLGMIRAGKYLLEDMFGVSPHVFVAGRWSLNNNTIKALVEAGITHDCSAIAHSKPCHYDWSRLPRVCMPYHPNRENYQENGDIPLTIIPVSQTLVSGNINPEIEPFVGFPWLKACFLEYYSLNAPLFHICLHSPVMTDAYFITVMDKLLKFISQFNIEFKFPSEINSVDWGKNVDNRSNILQYIPAINTKIAKSIIFDVVNQIKSRGNK